MHDAVHLARVALSRLSFQSTVVRFRLWWARASEQPPSPAGLVGYKGLVHDLLRDLNPWRPGRVGPRVKKRRPKPFPLITQPHLSSKWRISAESVATLISM